MPQIPPIPAGVAATGVVYLGPGLPDLEFPAPTVAPATSRGTGVRSGETHLPPERPDQYQAVDSVMASIVMLDDVADPKVVPALEDAMAELLSAELLAD